jgi:hypothetical protein
VGEVKLLSAGGSSTVIINDRGIISFGQFKFFIPLTMCEEIEKAGNPD